MPELPLPSVYVRHRSWRFIDRHSVGPGGRATLNGFSCVAAADSVEGGRADADSRGPSRGPPSSRWCRRQVGIGGPRLRCGCQTCWSASGSDCLPWATPERWHHIGLTAEKRSSPGHDPIGAKPQIIGRAALFVSKLVHKLVWFSSGLAWPDCRRPRQRPRARLDQNFRHRRGFRWRARSTGPGCCGCAPPATSHASPPLLAAHGDGRYRTRSQEPWARPILAVRNDHGDSAASVRPQARRDYALQS